MNRIEEPKSRVGMNISLTADLAKFVEAKVAGGQYATASEVLREGLRMLIEQDQLRQIRRDELREKVRQGREQSQRCDLVDGDEVFDRLEREIDEQERRNGKT